MSKTTKITLILVVLLSVCSTVGAYQLGNDRGLKQGSRLNAVKYNQGVQQGKDEMGPRVFDLQMKNNQLSDDYNKLVSGYNSLRDSVIKYVGYTQYQAKQPVRCTSNTINSFTYTNCY